MLRIKKKIFDEVDDVILATLVIAENEGINDCFFDSDTKGWLDLSKMLKFWFIGDAYELKSEDVKSGSVPIYIIFRLGLVFLLFEVLYRL